MKRYDADTLGHYITMARHYASMAKEILDDILGLAFLCGGLMGLWFIGCALA